ncbi:NAD-dependent deacetylase sirtuin-5 [Clonorchis sinensis]|uniref:NAD-dependent deacetylase sirtuin-5 n=1 Tax=Clonorchis sinensis TaxID=79923 RepID=G7Y3E5_CLOSI|nr:NAD-dependent deacetylase sirtuin-5 [Clonorchis sinensis]
MEAPGDSDSPEAGVHDNFCGWKTERKLMSRSPDLATPYAFYDDPGLVWEFYHYRRELVRKTRPNPGHLALADAEKRFNADQRSFTVVTQNVDGLHGQAGSVNVLELHGNLFKTRCTKCSDVRVNLDSPICPALENRGPVECLQPVRYKSDLLTLFYIRFFETYWTVCLSVAQQVLLLLLCSSPVFDPQLHGHIPEEQLPRCHKPISDKHPDRLCNGLLRPHVVWFGESLDTDVLRRVGIAMTSADACLVVGTSAVVYPAAGFAQELAARGVPVAEVNVEVTPATKSLGYFFQGKSGEILPELFNDLSLS